MLSEPGSSDARRSAGPTPDAATPLPRGSRHCSRQCALHVASTLPVARIHSGGAPKGLPGGIEIERVKFEQPLIKNFAHVLVVCGDFVVQRSLRPSQGH